MWFAGKFAVKTALNALALWVAIRFISGFSIAPHAFRYLEIIRGLSPLAQTLIVGGLVLAILNTFVRPILKLVSLPFIFVTFGLFNIVINVIILWLADWYLAELTISGFLPLLYGSILIGIVNIPL